LKRPAIIAGLVAAAALVVPASALAAEYVYPSEAVATDGLLWEAVRKADEFWIARVGRTAAPPLVCVFDDTESAARGNMNGRKVWFERSFVQTIREMIRSKHRMIRRSAYESLFRAAAHERGHNLGFRHEDGGIMGDLATPGMGVDWAREKAR
jgi:hypothetical protein